jgi:transposase-like protein
MPRRKRKPPQLSKRRAGAPPISEDPEVYETAAHGVEYEGERCCRIAAAIARLDGSEYDVAEALGVSASTLRRWRKTHPEFALALKPPTESTDGSAVRAAIKHALGSDYRTDKILQTRQGPAVRSEEIHVPPNIEVAHFLLKFRMPTVYGVSAGAKPHPIDAYLDKMDRKIAAARQELNGQPRTASTSGAEQKELRLDVQTCRIARIMSHLAADDAEMAGALGISEPTLSEWKRRCADFAKAIEDGNEAVNCSLERALAQRATGYSYYAEKIICDAEGTIRRLRLLTHVPPSDEAIEIWQSAHPKETG